MRITISQIANHNKAAGGHYFRRETLKFFNQRQSDFRIYQTKGRIFVYAPSFWESWTTGKLEKMGYSIGEYNPETGDVSGVKLPGGFNNRPMSADAVKSALNTLAE